MVRKSKSIRRSRRRSGKRKFQSGGTLPSEFFGGNSGRYSANPGAAYPSAYGVTEATSHGVILPGGNVTGPNLGPAPNTSGNQTGGRRRSRRRSRRSSRHSSRRFRRSRRSSRRSRRSRRSSRRSRHSRKSRRSSRCSCKRSRKSKSKPKKRSFLERLFR